MGLLGLLLLYNGVELGVKKVVVTTLACRSIIRTCGSGLYAISTDTISNAVTFRFSVRNGTRNIFCIRVGGNGVGIRPCRCCSHGTVVATANAGLVGLVGNGLSPIITFAANGLGISNSINTTLRLVGCVGWVFLGSNYVVVLVQLFFYSVLRWLLVHFYRYTRLYQHT